MSGAMPCRPSPPPVTGRATLAKHRVWQAECGLWFLAAGGDEAVEVGEKSEEERIGDGTNRALLYYRSAR